jgi:ATPase subunit of ABC transporter with duplicated ATPase domains
VLLLDEPVIGLDDEHRERFVHALTERSETYLIISHDSDFLKAVTTKRFRLHRGTLEER